MRDTSGQTTWNPVSGLRYKPSLILSIFSLSNGATHPTSDELQFNQSVFKKQLDSLSAQEAKLVKLFALGCVDEYAIKVEMKEVEACRYEVQG